MGNVASSNFKTVRAEQKHRFFFVSITTYKILHTLATCIWTNIYMYVGVDGARVRRRSRVSETAISFYRLQNGCRTFAVFRYRWVFRIKNRHYSPCQKPICICNVFYTYGHLFSNLKWVKMAGVQHHTIFRHRVLRFACEQL